MSKFVSCCYCDHATDYIAIGQGEDESVMGTCFCDKNRKRVNVLGEEFGCTSGKKHMKKELA